MSHWPLWNPQPKRYPARRTFSLLHFLTVRSTRRIVSSKRPLMKPGARALLVAFASAIAETALISYLSVRQAELPILTDLSLMRLQGIERPVSLFGWLQHGGNSAKPAASSSPLLPAEATPPQPPPSAPHRRRNIAPISALEALEENSSSSWSDSGASHISFRGEIDSLALQNASYGVDHLSAELKLMSKRMRPPRRVRMTKAGLKNHPPKICHENGNDEWE